MRVGQDQKKAARVADLYGYLLKYHPETVTIAGVGRLKSKTHDSLVITKNMGYVHNSIGKSGNGIDYLMEYEGYSFQRAVACLSSFGNSKEDFEIRDFQQLIRPEKTDKKYAQLYAYLMQRGIDDKIITALCRYDLLYQEKNNNNIVFNALDYVESCGSLSYKDKRFKRIEPGSSPSGYWCFGAGKKEDSICYICESGIDALSLYCLKKAQNNTYFASMGGLKKNTLKRIEQEFLDVIIAVDNDSAGDEFAQEFNTYPRIKPTLKDWNEDLQNERAQEQQEQERRRQRNTDIGR